jgi:hypothetical protein
MKKKKYSFIFNIGEPVKIIELKLNGRISGIYIGPQLIEYRVRYFKDGEPQDLYFNPNELELIEDEKLRNPLLKND